MAPPSHWSEAPPIIHQIENLIRNTLKNILQSQHFEIAAFWSNFRKKLPETTKYMIFGNEDIDETNTINLNREFQTANRINPDKSIYSNLSLADQVLMIFTSGTTGLPKGNMTHMIKYILFESSSMSWENRNYRWYRFIFIFIRNRN